MRILTAFLIPALLGLFAVASAQLPPKIEADKNMVLAEQLYAAKDYAEAFKVMEKVIALQKEHNLTLSDEFHFKYAQVALSADSTRIALESVSKYLSATGREGEFYKEALTLLVEVERTEIRAEEICAGKPKGAECWKELASHPQCYVWDDDYDEDRTVTWSGKCSRNLVQGTGELSWEKKNEDGELTRGSYEETGSLERGKKHGRWVEHSSIDAEIREGSYVEGKKDGLWVTRNLWGHLTSERKGHYVEGKKNGLWVWSNLWGDPDDKQEGHYVDGKKHGKWVYEYRHRKEEVSYEEDKEHGKWVLSSWSGAILHGSYVDGKKHGEFYGENELCTWQQSSLKVTVRGKYVEGKQQGYWKNDPYTDGISAGSGHYDEDGLKQGTWTIWTDYCFSHKSFFAKKEKGDYIDGKREGTWLLYDFFPSDDRTCMSYIYDQDEQVKKKEVNMKICREAGLVP